MRARDSLRQAPIVNPLPGDSSWPADASMTATPSTQVRRHVLFTGHVQGVGFRFTVRSLATDRPIAGWVRNLPDGRVEMVAESSPAELDRFVSAVQGAMRGHIRNMEVAESAATGEFHGFAITQ